MDIDFEQVLENVRVVDTNRNYWFIRSYSGKLYNEYYENGFIGLGLNSIPYEFIKVAARIDQPTFDQLRNSIKRNYDFKEGTVTSWANQLINFEHAVKPGDMIIMPDEGSSQYAFGIVESSTYLTKDERTFVFEGKFEPMPEKRRKVKWLKEIDKTDLNDDFRSLSSNHSAISYANPYRETIEGQLSSLYIIEDRIYFTIKINQDEDINAFAFNDFLSGLTYFYKEYCEANGFEDNEQLYLKIKMQSKGKMSLNGLIVGGIVFVATLFALSDNTELKAELGKYKFDFKSDGLLKSLSNQSNYDKDKDLERKIRYEKWRDSIDRVKAGSVANPVKAEDEKKIYKEIKHIHNETINVQNIQVINNNNKDELGPDTLKKD